jgi:tetratricopeptide (TPR) repeat protein
MMRSVIVMTLLVLVSTASAQPAKDRERQGRTLLAQQKWDEAIVDLSAALAAEPGRIAVLFALARAYEGRHDDQLAIDTYLRYPDAGPDAAEAKSEILRLQTAIKDKQRSTATALASQAHTDATAGGIDAAIVGYEEAYKLSPQPEFLLAIAQLCETKGDKRRAIQQYTRYNTVATQSQSSQAQQAIKKLEHDLESESTASMKRGEAELAAREAWLAGKDARAATLAITEAVANHDTPTAAAKLQVGRTASTKATIASGLAARAAQAAVDASRIAGTPEAQRMAEESSAFAVTAKQESDAARESVDGAARLVAVQPPEPAARNAPTPENEPTAPGHGLRVSGVVVASAGGAALLTGIAFSVLARSAANDVSSGGEQWTTHLDARVAAGQRDENISLTCYGAAAVLAVSGVVMVYLGSRARHPHVSPTASARSAGLQLSWSY